MRIDPVVVLMDELEFAYHTLAHARDRRDWAETRRGLARVAQLHAALRETEPRSVIGAAHLLREAASMLPRSAEPYHGDRLCAIAARLDEGQRAFADIVWLRAICREMGRGAAPFDSAAALIRLALKGVCRPVLLYRAVTAPQRPGNSSEHRRARPTLSS